MPFSEWMGGQSGGVIGSCIVHAVLLFGTGSAVMQPARYNVETGAGGMEVALIAAPLPPVDAAPVPMIPKVPEEEPAAAPPEPDDWMLDSVPLPPPQAGGAETPTSPSEEHPDALRQTAPVYGDGSSLIGGSDPTTLFLSGGALSGKGGRFRNPAPPYPYAAIQQQQEGVVLLQAVIDKAGRPISVEIARSSGCSLLDQSALRTVRRWKFDAAHIGFLPVQSTIMIPIRFVLGGAILRTQLVMEPANAAGY